MSEQRPVWQLLTLSEYEPLSCHECIAILIYLADLGASGVDDQWLWKIARRHLARCIDCREHLRRHLRRLERLQAGGTNV